VDGRGIGITTKRALTLIDRGKEPFEAGRLTNQEKSRSSAGNGCVMRCVPVGLRYHDDPDRLIRVSTQQAAITHADERCTWGAAAVNLAARELLHGNIYFIDEVVHRIGDRAPRALREAIHRVPRERESDLPIARAGEAGYVVHCVEIAFWFATHDRSLEEALIALGPGGRRHRHECRSGGRPARRAVWGCRVTAALDRPDHRIRTESGSSPSAWCQRSELGLLGRPRVPAATQVDSGRFRASTSRSLSVIEITRHSGRPAS